jgi:hypothetical protein
MREGNLMSIVRREIVCFRIVRQFDSEKFDQLDASILTSLLEYLFPVSKRLIQIRSLSSCPLVGSSVFADSLADLSFCSSTPSWRYFMSQNRIFGGFLGASEVASLLVELYHRYRRYTTVNDQSIRQWFAGFRWVLSFLILSLEVKSWASLFSGLLSSVPYSIIRNNTFSCLSYEHEPSGQPHPKVFPDQQFASQATQRIESRALACLGFWTP